MTRISFPIQPGAHGEAVADLQDALLRLLNLGLLALVPAEHQTAAATLSAERAETTMGEETRRLLLAFQAQRQLPQSGTVDRETAAQLNAQLERVGTLLPLRTPPPASVTSAEPAVGRLLPLLRTSPALAEGDALDRLAQRFAARSERDPRQWPIVARDAGLSPTQIDDLALTLEFAAVTDRDGHLVAALQALRGSGRVRSGRDLMALTDDEWRAMLRRTTPGADPGSVNARLALIHARLHARYPSASVAEAVATAPELDAAPIRRVLDAHPDLDLARHVPADLRLDGFSAEERAAAARSLEALRREINAYPDFDYRAALAAGDRAIENPIRSEMARFLDQAPDFELASMPVARYAAAHPRALADISAPSRVFAQLQRMQRVYRVTRDAYAMTALLEEGIHSAFRIVRMPPEIFVARLGPRLGGDATARGIYAAARVVAATTAAIGWAARLRVAGPLPSAVGAWPPPPLKVTEARLAKLLGTGGGRGDA
jgi:hypothetical protein